MTKDVLEPVEEDATLDCLTTISPHQRPVIHQVASAPMPDECEFSFFDPSEPQCREVMQDPSTTIPELFAVLRQWVPQVQKNIDLIGNEILNRGCGVNDRDGLTDMSLLHYCCKAGAPGIGDADTAAGFARHLLALGADPNLRSRWTNMRALHYAAYFDVPHLIRVVLQASQPGDIDATCSDFDFGTALHIAASNLCTSAVSCLLELGANPAFKDDKGQYPADVVPEPLDMPIEMADAASLAKELRTLLGEALPQPSSLPLRLQVQTPPALSDKARIKLASIGIQLGDRVVIAGHKVGTLQFCGNTEFSGGLWAGVVLEKPEGKNDGSVAGVQYFTCQRKHGVFAPLSKISKHLERRKRTNKVSTPARPRRIDLSLIPPKTNTGLGDLSQSLSSSTSSLESRHGQRPRPRPHPRQRLITRQQREHISQSPCGTAGYRSQTPSASSSVCGGPEVRLGDRVLVVGQRTGVVHFFGKTSFAPGHWLGIALDTPSGKNDGSVGAVRYFNCPPRHGVFAPPSRVQRIHGSVDCLSELSSSHLNHPSISGVIRRSFSTSSAIAPPKETSRRNPVTRSRSHPHRRRWSTLSGGSGSSIARSPAGTVYSSDKQVRLHEGMQVLLNSANEMASIRYMGTTDFAPGLWLGLELRSPKGKNDGSVHGHRYFTCRPDHGALVRPNRVTYRGINGSCLVDENS
ncbi:CAP-Gly domain-containing linker protein 4-like isoform X1 [Phyllopteryx taeniolatus]|uniref:CAP-Gly domain-containing linker protein 4-like isoform X1 n=1 Tax=Phyllopteryx taeniolatus TaxID=161469 RepID=UPI002AD21BF1|nr:CAP-Gly domain-containing linker protein 4-like isoform X1 [Phyllopteryx taeniolatus]XP_061651458.1 CAP-Gly domain-containing linker protein 4-like isoform X1 [Phyllopteryx taeniolatus]